MNRILQNLSMIIGSSVLNHPLVLATKRNWDQNHMIFVDGTMITKFNQSSPQDGRQVEYSNPIEGKVVILDHMTGRIIEKREYGFTSEESKYIDLLQSIYAGAKKYLKKRYWKTPSNCSVIFQPENLEVIICFASHYITDNLSADWCSWWSFSILNYQLCGNVSIGSCLNSDSGNLHFRNKFITLKNPTFDSPINTKSDNNCYPWVDELYMKIEILENSFQKDMNSALEVGKLMLRNLRKTFHNSRSPLFFG